MVMLEMTKQLLQDELWEGVSLASIGPCPHTQNLCVLRVGQLDTPVEHASAPHKVSLRDRVYIIPLPLYMYNSKVELLEIHM